MAALLLDTAEVHIVRFVTFRHWSITTNILVIYTYKRRRRTVISFFLWLQRWPLLAAFKKLIRRDEGEPSLETRGGV